MLREVLFLVPTKRSSGYVSLKLICNQFVPVNVAFIPPSGGFVLLIIGNLNGIIRKHALDSTKFLDMKSIIRS